MSWKDVGKFAASNGAKLLGSVLGGPASVAGTVGKIVASAFGAEGEPEDKVLAAIQADPNSAVKLLEIEAAHKEKLEELKIETEKLQIDEAKAYLQDRQDARRRETDVVKATGKLDLNLYVLAWVVVGGFFVICIMLMFVKVPAEGIARDSIFLLLGGLVSGFSTVLGYFFGSSKGSADKTAMMANGTSEA